MIIGTHFRSDKLFANISTHMQIGTMNIDSQTRTAEAIAGYTAGHADEPTGCRLNRPAGPGILLVHTCMARRKSLAGICLRVK